MLGSRFGRTSRANVSRGVPLVAWLGLVVVLGACGRTPLPPPPDPDPASRAVYRIGASDVLAVSVWKNPEVSLQQVPVRPDGKISVPLAGDVQAAGNTTDELKAKLTEALAEYITAPDVTVVVVQMNSQRVSVMGEVNRPGPVPLAVDTRVLDAISAAGGFTVFADRGRVRVLRQQSDGTVQEYHFDYDDYVSGSAIGTNFLLRAGDSVVVPD